MYEYEQKIINACMHMNLYEQNYMYEYVHVWMLMHVCMWLWMFMENHNPCRVSTVRTFFQEQTYETIVDRIWARNLWFEEAVI